MKVKDILMSDFISDDTKVRIERPLCGTLSDIRRGKWYEDHILDLMDQEIDRFAWSPAAGVSIVCVPAEMHCTVSAEGQS